jgi:hypothetical protein
MAAGCASEETQSFNQNFNQDLPTSPQYVIEDKAPDHFKIRVYQGTPLNSPERVTYLKQAATTVAEDECHRRGWTNWKFDYIQERDQGWMHVLVAEVWERPPLAVTPAPPTLPPPAVQNP